MEESRSTTGSKAALGAFFEKQRKKRKAPAGQPPPEKKDDSGWDESVSKEQEEAALASAEEIANKEKLRNASKKYLFGVWKTILSTYGTYAGASDAMKAIFGSEQKIGIPVEWTPTTAKLPAGYSATLEKTGTYFIIKAFDKERVEVVHLTIPRDMLASKDLHFTWGIDGAQKESVQYDAEGGRSLKQKRTRRVVRRLVGTRSSRFHSTRRVRHSLSVLKRNTR